jgi:hypothetical protein
MLKFYNYMPEGYRKILEKYIEDLEYRAEIGDATTEWLKNNAITNVDCHGSIFIDNIEELLVWYREEVE